MAKQIVMTESGLEKLQQELDFLKSVKRKEAAENVGIARSFGDLSENSEYDEAKSEQAKIEARIQELEYQLENAVIIDSVAGDHVSMGSKVTVVRDGKEFVYEIVGFSQSDPSNGKISDESPVGKALMGASIGEKVTVEAPIGMLEFEIKSID